MREVKRKQSAVSFLWRGGKERKLILAVGLVVCCGCERASDPYWDEQVRRSQRECVDKLLEGNRCPSEYTVKIEVDRVVRACSTEQFGKTRDYAESKIVSCDRGAK